MTNYPHASESGIVPSGGQHAIEVMALAIEWSKPLESHVLTEIAAVARANQEFRDFFPAERAFPGFEIKMTADGASFDRAGFNIVDFLRSNIAGQQEWSFSMRPEFFSCNCTVYDRWANVKPRAISLLSQLAQLALERGSAIQAVGLQYSDAFRWNIDNKEALSQLFRQDSPLLPSSIFSREMLWHSHNGWFSAAPDGHRLLNVVNIDSLDELPNRVIRINGQHRMQAVAASDGTALPIELNLLDSAAELLHKSNKVVLQDLLSDLALELIHMKKVDPN